MPTKIPSIGSANWGQDLNTIFTDILVDSTGSKPTPGTVFAGTGKAYVEAQKLYTDNINIYVSTTGNDTTNTGLSSTSAFLTLAKAVSIANTAFPFPTNITINVAPGTYTLPTEIVVNNKHFTTILGNANPNLVIFNFTTNGINFKSDGKVSGIKMVSTYAYANNTIEIEIEEAVLKKALLFEGRKNFVENIVINKSEVGIMTNNQAIVEASGNITIDECFTGVIAKNNSAFNSYPGYNLVLNVNFKTRGLLVTRNSRMFITALNTTTSITMVGVTSLPAGYGVRMEGIRVTQSSFCQIDGFKCEISNVRIGVFVVSSSTFYSEKVGPGGALNTASGGTLNDTEIKINNCEKFLVSTFASTAAIRTPKGNSTVVSIEADLASTAYVANINGIVQTTGKTLFANRNGIVIYSAPAAVIASQMDAFAGGVINYGGTII